MSQTTYSQRLTAAVAGQLSCPLQEAVLDSKINAAAISAGIFVTRDGADDAVKAPTTSAEVTASGMGWIKRDVARTLPAAGSPDYAAKEGVTVMRKGRMWVNCETACAYGGAVFVRFTVEAPDLVLGTVRNDADTDKAVAFPGAKFVSTLSGAGLAEIEVA